MQLNDFLFLMTNRPVDEKIGFSAEVTSVNLSEEYSSVEIRMRLLGDMPRHALKYVEKAIMASTDIKNVRFFVDISSFLSELTVKSALDWISLLMIREDVIENVSPMIAQPTVAVDERGKASIFYPKYGDIEEKDATTRKHMQAYFQELFNVDMDIVFKELSETEREERLADIYESYQTSLDKMCSHMDDTMNNPSDDSSSTSIDVNAEGKQKNKKAKQNAEQAPTNLNKDSWAYKAQLAQTTKKEEPDKKGKKAFDIKDIMKNTIYGRVKKSTPIIPTSHATSDAGLIRIEGCTKLCEAKLTKQGDKVIFSFFVTDATSSVKCVSFLTPADADKLEEAMKESPYMGVECNMEYNRFENDTIGSVKGIYRIDPPAKRMDDASEKRVELHVHTKMSDNDAVIDPVELISTAYRMGHCACAVTDHGVVQAFNDAYAKRLSCIKGKDPESFKIIYGMEGYLVDDGPCIAYHMNEENRIPLDSFVALDVETTGLDCVEDQLIEIAAVRYVRNDIGEYAATEEFTTFVNPGFPIPEKAIEITNITDDMVKDAPTPYEAAKLLATFLKEDEPLCGHNIFFDMGFIREAGFQIDIEKHTGYRVKFNQVAIDTVSIATYLYPDMKQHNLAAACSFLSIENSTPHRALSDAKASAGILLRAIADFSFKECAEMNEKVGKLPNSEITKRKQTVCHIIFLARDTLGLYNLYRMVSESHMEYFSLRPRLPKSVIRYLSNAIIIGSACERGEVFREVHREFVASGLDTSKTADALMVSPTFLSMVRLYDYLEIQPICNNAFYLRDEESGLHTESDLKAINYIIYTVAKRLGMPCCATTDAHFLEKKDGEYRRYMLMNMGYKDAEQQADLYFRTTDEMLDEFDYLGEQGAHEVVISNTNAIAKRIKADMRPFPGDTYPPIITTAAQEITDIVWNTAKSLYEYENEIPQIITDRVNKELGSIIEHGYAIMYYIAYKLVKKSNEDGYVVGSRGSVGSSLIATFSGISEVNPLPPHRRCPNCHYSAFDLSGTYGSGYDLPIEACPKCGTMMISDGQDIPFETFLGFHGDKQPDIDLNFSGEYQARAHKYVEELFGKNHTFRAGTIGCYAEKNALGIVRKVMEMKNETLTQAEQLRRASGIINVKRTTGQHPGGIVVLPKEMDIYEFTPIQHPANKIDCGITTTHFDFNALHDTILKLDILGHDDPTMLRMLSDLTGVDVRHIPIPDEKVMSLFFSTEALGIPNGTSPAEAATLGLSEMGTKMARDMIKETKPHQFYDLVQLMGLSHGTDVWKGNAQDLIREGTCTLNSVIGCRDGIMTQLIYWNVPPVDAFSIMEKVRKGKGLTPEHEALMRENNVPEWYIDSCKKIKYMFPKAHAVAYAISSLRIAWFKVYYPEEYYCAFFSIRADEFDGDILCNGIRRVQDKRMELNNNFLSRKPNEKALFYLCELVEEMYLRGITFAPYSITESDAYRFKKIAKGVILPPLNAIPSISKAMAESIVKARKDGPFQTREDLARRSLIGPSAMKKLVESKVLDDLPESNQIDLFSLM